MAVTKKEGSWIQLTSCDADFTFTNPINLVGIVLQPSAMGDTCLIRDTEGDKPDIEINSIYGLAFTFPRPIWFTPSYVKASSVVTTTNLYSVLFFVE